MAQYCRFCGEKLRRPDARFCSKCGRELTAGVGGTRTRRLQGPRLMIQEPGTSSREELLDRETVTLGRRLDSDIVVALPYVSGYHARVERQANTFLLTDLGSTNGTFVNGQRVSSAILRDGDIIRIGDLHGNSVSLIYRSDGIDSLPSAAGTIHLGQHDLARKSAFVIGRDSQADIPLASPIVSWHHARVDQTPSGHVLTDLNSTNGTFTNGQRIRQPCLLRRGDVIQIGHFKLIYEAVRFDHYATTGGVRLDGVRLTRRVGPGRATRTILQDVSISIYPREFVALVGASGAGKSTLMNALSGFRRAEGRVLLDGDDLYGRYDLYRSMLGYVPQDDIIHRDLTVASALRYVARLRLPPDTTLQEIKQRIDLVLGQVEMAGQRNQLIASLSGGQRKRVNIGVEMLADPKLFFLDEPTSGLDPGLEKKMMFTLRRLADTGKTVVLVTHATANINQCDHVAFMALGRLVFFGPPHDALTFFGVTSGDYADIYAQLDDPDPDAAQKKSVYWEQRFQQSAYYQQYIVARQQAMLCRQPDTATTAQRGPTVNPLRQFVILTQRYLDLVVHDKLLLFILLAVMPLIGVLITLISKSDWLVGLSSPEITQVLLDKGRYAPVGNAQTLAFVMSLAAVLLGLFGAAYEIVKERAIYERERMINLRIGPYLASKFVVLGMFALLQCLLLLVVVGLKVRYPRAGVLLGSGVPLELYVTLLLATLVSILMGLLVSALAPDANAIIYVVLLMLFMQIIFGGTLFELPAFTKPISYLTVTRWAVDAYGSIVDMGRLRDMSQTRFDPEPTEVEIDGLPGTKIVDLDPIQQTMGNITFQVPYSHSAGHVCGTWVVLGLFGMAFGSLTAYVQRRKDQI